MHVWDSFLTEQDKAHLAILGTRRRREPFGVRPAVLNIDNYRWVAGDQPEPILEQIKMWPSAMGYAAWDALDHIAELLVVARGAGLPIAHVHGLPDSSGMPGRRETASMTPPALDRYMRRNEFMPQAAPLPGEIVLEKSAASAFFGTPLIAGLTAHGVDTLIITGESTSGCVRASVMDAMSHCFKVVIPEECVYDRHEASHAINLFDMHQKYATVMPLADVTAWIAEWSATQTAPAPVLATV